MNRAIHLQLIILGCLAWLGTLVIAAFRVSVGALFGFSAIAQFAIFTYGVLLYQGWLTNVPHRWLKPTLWWLPQTVFFTVSSYDPATPTLGGPIGGFCAAMPLQLSVSAGWYLEHSSLTVSFNLLAGLCALWALSIRDAGAAPQDIGGLRFRTFGRWVAGILLAVPLILLVVAAFARATGITTWTKTPPPKGLEQVTLASGKVVRVASLAPVKFEDGGE